MTKVPLELLEDVASATTDDSTSLSSSNSGKVVQLNGQGAIPSVYFAPVVDQWRLTADLTGSSDPIASSLSRYKKLGGDDMSMTSGVWTFPKTGVYKVEAVMMTRASAATGSITGTLSVSTDQGQETPTWSVVSEGAESGLPTVEYGSLILCALVDVTSTVDVAVKFSIAHSDDTNKLIGHTSINKTFFTFTRIGDT